MMMAAMEGAMAFQKGLGAVRARRGRPHCAAARAPRRSNPSTDAMARGGGRAGGEMMDLGGRMLLVEGPMGEEIHLRVPRGATPGQTVNMRIPISPRDYR